MIDIDGSQAKSTNQGDADAATQVSDHPSLQATSGTSSTDHES